MTTIHGHLVCHPFVQPCLPVQAGDGMWSDTLRFHFYYCAYVIHTVCVNGLKFRPSIDQCNLTSETEPFRYNGRYITPIAHH
jgi:hypothetical protein